MPTELGAIELAVPRTRRVSAVEVVRADARRAKDADRMILACLMLGPRARNVSAALLAVPVALGVRENGRTEVVGFRLAPAE